MCSIITIDTSSYYLNKTEFKQNLIQEQKSNPHGYAAIFMADDEKNDGMIRTMNFPALLDFIDRCFNNEGRIFIHLRYATTKHIGLAFTHGFGATNSGQFIMHNGILTNYDDLKVDSFMLESFESPDDAFDTLNHLNETYANVFWIDLETREYSVFRLKTGSLYTDNNGNYSTQGFGLVSERVATGSIESFPLSYYSYDQYGWSAYDEDYYDSKYLAEPLGVDYEMSRIQSPEKLKVGNE